MHTALSRLAQLQSAGIAVTCGHLRLMCKVGDGNEKGSLGAVLPVLARHSQVFVEASTHDVSAMHVRVGQGELTQLVGMFDGVSKLGLIDFSASSGVLEEAVCIPGLSVLQLRDEFEGKECAVQAAFFYAEAKRSHPLCIEIATYPLPRETQLSISLIAADWVECFFVQWGEATADVQGDVSVTLSRVPLRFANDCYKFYHTLNDELVL